MKIIVNITTWIDVGSFDAEHYYAKMYEIENNDNIYNLANNLNFEADPIELHKKITQKEATKLNVKDNHTSYKEGDESNRFDSIEEIKKLVLDMYSCDVAFLKNWELKSESDIHYNSNTQIKKTGEVIQIHNFEGFSSEFVHLIEGSEHDVIETPYQYKDRKLQDGKWVMGITEPVLVLTREYILI